MNAGLIPSPSASCGVKKGGTSASLALAWTIGATVRSITATT
jgi:hypothetical protein